MAGTTLAALSGSQAKRSKLPRRSRGGGTAGRRRTRRRGTRRLRRRWRGFGRRRVGRARAEQYALRVAVEVADGAAEIGERAARVDRQRLVFAQAVVGEARQPDRDL